MMFKKEILILMIVFIVATLFLVLLTSNVEAAEYTVKKNDSLWKIARKQYNLKDKVSIDKAWRAISQTNKLKSPDKLKAGDKLNIPDENKIEALYATYRKTHVPVNVKRAKATGIPNAPKGWEYWKSENTLVTAYPPKSKKYGRFNDGRTSIGHNAFVLDGVAAYPGAVPYYTKVYVPASTEKTWKWGDVGFREVDDTGGAMKSSWKRRRRLHIDVRMIDRDICMLWGDPYIVVHYYRKTKTPAIASL